MSEVGSAGSQATAAPLYLLGGGGHARVVSDALRRSEVAIAGVVDPLKPDATFEGLPVLRAYPERGMFIVTVGQVRTTGLRERIWNEALAAGLTPASPFVEDRSARPLEVRIADGTVVLGGAYVGVGTVIGVNCIVNHHAVIEHDCEIGDHIHVSPGAIIGGGVRIGRRSHVGLGAVVRQGIAVGEDVTIGAGAVVIDDVPAHATVVGVPARPLTRG